jgi:poly(3-hydroxybutyrate) depolymerase
MERQMGRRKRCVPLLIVHSTGDRLINVSAALKVQESWARSFAIETSRPSWSTSGTTKGTAWIHRRYQDADGADTLETLLLDHKEHGWYGGRDGKFGYADAPDVSEAIWRFFQSHTLASTSSGNRLFGHALTQRVA